MKEFVNFSASETKYKLIKDTLKNIFYKDIALTRFLIIILSHLPHLFYKIKHLFYT